MFNRSTCDLKRLILAALGVVSLGLSGVAMTGCNTTEGVGEDIEAVGESIDETAEDAN